MLFSHCSFKIITSVRWRHIKSHNEYIFQTARLQHNVYENGDIVVENPILVMMQQGPNWTKTADNDTDAKQNA